MGIENLIDFTARERHFIECTTVGGIIAPLIRMNHYDCYVYGAGRAAENILLFFADQGVQIKGIIDQDITKKSKKLSFGCKYIHTSEIKDKIPDPSRSFCIINNTVFRGMNKVLILQTLINAGFDKLYVLSQYDLDQIYGTNYEIDYCKRGYFVNNVEALNKTYDLLSDQVSRDTMIEFLRTHIQCGTYSLPQSNTRNKYFYDGISVEDKKDIYLHLEDEVWLNCGSSIGDSIFLYFDLGLKAKRIYAYEGETVAYGCLSTSLEYLPEEYRDAVIPIKEYVSEGTDFKKYITDRITLINADIEGYELQMLKALESIIINDRPVLAITVYHKETDLVEIPQYIDSLVKDYSYVLRKYESNIYSSSKTTELVFYAIPNDRYCL